MVILVENRHAELDEIAAGSRGGRLLRPDGD
jgi:hypothetical protein